MVRGACRGACMPRGVHARRCMPGECVWPEGHVCPRGVCVPGGVHTRRGICAKHAPPLDRMTDACENITLPQNSFAGGNEQNFLDYLMCGHLNVLIKIFQNLLEIIPMTSQTEKTSTSIGPRKRSVLKFRYIL